MKRAIILQTFQMKTWHIRRKLSRGYEFYEHNPKYWQVMANPDLSSEKIDLVHLQHQLAPSRSLQSSNTCVWSFPSISKSTVHFKRLSFNSWKISYWPFVTSLLNFCNMAISSSKLYAFFRWRMHSRIHAYLELWLAFSESKWSHVYCKESHDS